MKDLNSRKQELVLQEQSKLQQNQSQIEDFINWKSNVSPILLKTHDQVNGISVIFDQSLIESIKNAYTIKEPEITQTIEAAHNQLIFHKEYKPTNALLSRDHISSNEGQSTAEQKQNTQNEYRVDRKAKIKVLTHVVGQYKAKMKMCATKPGFTYQGFLNRVSRSIKKDLYQEPFEIRSSDYDSSNMYNKDRWVTFCFRNENNKSRGICSLVRQYRT